MLPEILESIRVSPNTGHSNLLEWIEALKPVKPWRMNGFAAWQVVSGIMCSNATGDVTIIIGDGVQPVEKVFAATEVWALGANQHVSSETLQLIDYCKQCFARRTAIIPFAYVAI